MPENLAKVIVTKETRDRILAIAHQYKIPKGAVVRRAIDLLESKIYTKQKPKEDKNG